MALEQNKGRRPHSHSGNKESNLGSSAEVKNPSEIKKRESAPLSEKEQDLKAQIAKGKRLQEDRPTGRNQGKEDLSFLDRKLSQEGKRSGFLYPSQGKKRGEAQELFRYFAGEFSGSDRGRAGRVL